MSDAKQFQEKIQTFGRFLSGMIMPNIGAFIAWGLITTLFIPTGWAPNEGLSKLVGPMIVNLLPLLIGYTGGKMVGGVRGGVVGAIATMGIIVGTTIPMFLGAMIMGPLGGYIIKKIDDAVEGKIPAGFEMLVNNFTAGIAGMLLSLSALKAFGPIMQGLSEAVSRATSAIVNAGLLPLASIVIEPAKILFLNNTLNWGVFTPLGVAEVAEKGKSIFFMLETNPGPGLGILLAIWLFAKGMTKESAPGAIIIHFLGGIHEIYFPYVLMQPLLVLAAIAGGMSGVFTFSMLGAGYIATPSPGSIFAALAMTPKGSFFANMAGIAVATVVSFLVASVIVKRTLGKEGDLEEAKEKMASLKKVVKDPTVEETVVEEVVVEETPVEEAVVEETAVEETPTEEPAVEESPVVESANEEMPKVSVSKIVVACDAGMGSSAMGASKLRNKIKAAGLDISVVNKSIENIPDDTDIVITHNKLTDRAKTFAPNAEHISIDNFMNNEQYDILVERLIAHKR